MKKRLTALLLCAALLLPSALCTDGENDLFASYEDYTGFTDVADGAWYASAVELCYRTGLMSGYKDLFRPQDTLTIAEVASVAARVRAAFTCVEVPPKAQGQKWYDPYLQYLTAAAADGADPSIYADLLASFDALPDKTVASRYQIFLCLQLATEGYLYLFPVVNSIQSLPDTDDPNVLLFYNIGILAGTSKTGLFNGDRPLTRMECAAMVARIIRPSLRVGYEAWAAAQASEPPVESQEPAPTETPVESQPPESLPQPSDPPAEAQEDPSAQLDGNTAMTVNGTAVTLSDFVSMMDWVIYLSDSYLYQQGTRLNWETDYGVGDLPTYFRALATQYCIESALKADKALELGCAPGDLAAALATSPSQTTLAGFAMEHDYLCAKHILILTTDPTTGQAVRSDQEAYVAACAVLDGMAAFPTLDQFNALLSVFGEDPGMAASPEGYLFSSGEMVAEFEQAVRELEIGSYTTQPVKSDYGYHVIWRMDPADHPDLLPAYQEAVLQQRLSQWKQSAQVVVNTALLQSIDVQGCYEAYMASFGQ